MVLFGVSGNAYCESAFGFRVVTCVVSPVEVAGNNVLVDPRYQECGWFFCNLPMYGLVESVGFGVWEGSEVEHVVKLPY